MKFKSERRQFLSVTSKYGFTVATVAAAGGLLYSEEAVAQSAQEERMREKEAETTITIATAYVLGASRTYPIMQLDYKENIQNFSNGKIYVKLMPGGQLGTGGALVTKVQNGTIQIAQHSISNFAPFAPEVDAINVPYWCANQNEFDKLVRSSAWRDSVHPKVEEKGFKVLSYIYIDPRVVALRKGQDNPAKVPSDLNGIKFRVPGSKILQQFYRLLGANPTPVAWGETTAAIKQGVADALDPSVEALSIFGFAEILSWVSLIESVPDAQVYSCNLEWLNGLSQELQDAVIQASEVTYNQNLAKVPAARAYAMSQLRKAGVQFYQPSADELKVWKDTAGYQLDVWNDTKIEVAGSVENFNKLVDAANS